MDARWIQAAARAAASAAGALALAGCGLTIPTDPDGTLDGVLERGTLRAGASPREPWVDVPAGDEAEPAGTEVELVEAFAEHLGVEVEWEVAGESELVERLKRLELDIVAGGLTADSPYADAVALTRPYEQSTDAEGAMKKHVLAVPVGENEMLSTLERFLDGREG